MKILLINHYAGSDAHGMEFRPYYLAQEWVKAGHSVHIVAASFSHLRVKNPEMAGKIVRKDVFSGINYSWLSVPHYKGNGIRRVLNMLTFIYRLFRLGRSFAEEFNPDVVIASSTYPMDIWPAYKIAKKADAQLIFEIHDLWPLSPMELGGYSDKHPYIKFMQVAEDFAYSKSDHVVSILPKVQNHVQERGFDVKKLHVIPNGIVPAMFSLRQKYSEEITDIEQHISELKDIGYFIVGYAGSHGVPNALSYLIDALAILKGEKIACVLVGDGSEKDALVAQAKTLPSDRVRFFNTINKADIPKLLSCFDLAYIGWNRHPLYRFGISPNKIMDYMMAGLPILHSVSAGNDPVRDAKCGLSVAPEDPNEISQGILQFKNMRDNERLAMGLLGRDFALANYTYPVLASRFASIFHYERE
jgi:glycosyltransferase involved in cell wall biosynthesis